LDEINQKSFDWTLLCHVTLYFGRHVYVTAPSCHLPNKLHCVTCWKTVTCTVCLLSYLTITLHYMCVRVWS